MLGKCKRNGLSPGRLPKCKHSVMKRWRFKGPPKGEEAELAVELRPKKRGIPDWLQSDLESHGYIFDVYGYLISAPDPLRCEGSAGQPDESG